MDDCVFCKIVRREIPAEILYEDDTTLAFLDIKPTAPGHTLVIPKVHFEDVFSASDEALAACMKTAKKVGPAVIKAVGGHGAHVNTNNGAAAGQIVFHLHFHIIPRRDRSEFEFWGHRDLSATEAAPLAAKIRAALA